MKIKDITFKELEQPFMFSSMLYYCPNCGKVFTANEYEKLVEISKFGWGHCDNCNASLILEELGYADILLEDFENIEDFEDEYGVELTFTRDLQVIIDINITNGYLKEYRKENK